MGSLYGKSLWIGYRKLIWKVFMDRVHGQLVRTAYMEKLYEQFICTVNMNSLYAPLVRPLFALIQGWAWLMDYIAVSNKRCIVNIRQRIGNVDCVRLQPQQSKTRPDVWRIHSRKQVWRSFPLAPTSHPTPPFPYNLCPPSFHPPAFSFHPPAFNLTSISLLPHTHTPISFRAVPPTHPLSH